MTAGKNGGETDLEAPDPLRAFLDALPPGLRRRLNVDADVVVDVTKLVLDGREPAELAMWVTYHVAGLDNAGAVMKHRLHRAAHPDELEQI